MRFTFAAAAACCIFPLTAMAQADDSPEALAVAARQGYMLMEAANMGPLAAMAKGEIPYDEDTAVYHASNLAALGQYEVQMHFIDFTAEGEVEGSEALPKIWDNFEDFSKKHDDYAAASAEAPEGVKGGAENVAAVVQKIGGTCKACHDQYRAK